MATFEVKVKDAVYEVDAPDEMTAWRMANETHTSSERSAEYQAKAAGAELPAGVRSAMNIGNSTLFGWGDELAGVAGGAASALQGQGFGPGYQDWRDTMRGAVESFRREYPNSAMLGDISGAMATGAPIGKLLATIPPATSVAGGIGRASGIGAGFGAVSGAGNAQTMEQVPEKALEGAAMSAAMGGALHSAGAGIGAIGRNVAQRNPAVSGAVAGAMGGNDPIDTAAMRMLATQMERDQATPGMTNARMRWMGPESRLVDAAGVNAANQLDVIANMPGQTGGSVLRAIKRRQITRFDRMDEALQSGLSPSGARLNASLEALDTARRTASDPLYARVRSTDIPIDSELERLLSRASKGLGEAAELARVEGKPFNLSASATVTPLMTPGGRTASLSQLDMLKRSLYELEQANINPETGRLSALGNAYKNLRRELVDKLDRSTIDPATGTSFYAAARNAYAGPTELRVAAKLGNDAMTKDAWKIADITTGMSASELEAFRIGAYEALRKKIGSQSGQTEIMNMFKNRGTREKLQEMFGSESEFLRFAKRVNAEETLKRLEGIGPRANSRTFLREAAADDLNGQMVRDSVGVVEGVAGRNPMQVWDAARRLWGRVSTPEPVRNRLGELYLQRGPQAEATLNRLRPLMEQIRRDNAYGQAYSGVVAPQMISPFVSPIIQ